MQAIALEIIRKNQEDELEVLFNYGSGGKVDGTLFSLSQHSDSKDVSLGTLQIASEDKKNSKESY